MTVATSLTTHATFASILSDDGKYRASVTEHDDGAEVKLYRLRPRRSMGSHIVVAHHFTGKWIMRCTVHEALDHISTIIIHLGGDDNTTTG